MYIYIQKVKFCLNTEEKYFFAHPLNITFKYSNTALTNEENNIPKNVAMNMNNTFDSIADFSLYRSKLPGQIL